MSSKVTGMLVAWLVELQRRFLCGGWGGVACVTACLVAVSSIGICRPARAGTKGGRGGGEMQDGDVGSRGKGGGGMLRCETRAQRRCKCIAGFKR